MSEQATQDTSATSTPTVSAGHSQYYNATGSNAQQDGVNSLKRIEFEFKGKRYRFALNPEQLTQEEPNRVTVVQTKGGAWVDDFGGGLVNISFKGTTGFKNRTESGTNGFSKFKELRDLIRQYYFKQTPGLEVKEDNELKFYNHTDGEAWVVVPKVFSLMRSVSRPLLYLYDIQLTAIRPAKLPNYVFDKFNVCISDVHIINNTSREALQKDLKKGIIIPPHSSTPTEKILQTVVPKVLTHQSLSTKSTNNASATVRTYVDIESRNAFTSEEDDAYIEPGTVFEYSGQDESDGTPVTTVQYSVDEALFEDYVKPVLPNDLSISISNLSEVVGDYGGRINSSTISVCLKDLVVIPPGILISGETIKAFGVENSGKIPFTYSDYNPNIPHSAFEIYSRLSQGGKDLLFSTPTYRDEVLSPLLLRMSTLPLELRLATQALYLCIYTLYIDLLTHQREGCPISLTRTDIQGILHNVDWLHNQVSCIGNIGSHIPFMEVLDVAIRNISFIKEYDSIFEGVQKEGEYITTNRCMPGYNPPKVIVSSSGGDYTSVY